MKGIRNLLLALSVICGIVLFACARNHRENTRVEADPETQNLASNGVFVPAVATSDQLGAVQLENVVYRRRYHRRVYRRSYYRTYPRRRYYRVRSKRKSAAIVAGSAAGGAAIGALAGGGKGAAIGALAGGGAGFVYDRATHKKRVQ